MTGRKKAKEIIDKINRGEKISASDFYWCILNMEYLAGYRFRKVRKRRL